MTLTLRRNDAFPARQCHRRVAGDGWIGSRRELSMLTIENLSRRFGQKLAVDSVDLEVKAGSFVGVIGRSGAGKSTLLRMINRLVDPSSGRILSGGIDVTALRGQALRDWRRSSAMIFQQFNLVGRLDVLTNVLI
jgi:phosphonate transport system ATP-binding protein